MKITRSDQGKTIEVPKGTGFLVELQENPSTGYRWQFDIPPNAAEITHTEYQSSPDTGVGGGGLRTFHITLKVPGPVPLRAQLVRPWEGAKSAIDTFAVTVVAK